MAEKRDELLRLTPKENETIKQRQAILEAARRVNDGMGSHRTIPEMFPGAIRISDLESAADRGDTALAKVAIKEGADVNEAATAREKITGVKGYKVLHVAAENGHVEVVKLLIGLGANSNAKLANGKTALDLARENDHKAVIQVLTNH
jgi:hypothetical protein